MCTHMNRVEEDHKWAGIIKRQLHLSAYRKKWNSDNKHVFCLGIWEMGYVNRKKNGNNGMIY